ncbi:putative late blight resistance protein R1-A-like, partial [Capsicum annuum]
MVLAIRGTFFKNPTIRRDIEDDLRYLAWESLKGSFRFDRILSALKSIFSTCKGAKMCIIGHSLGAGFALSDYVCCYYNQPVGVQNSSFSCIKEKEAKPGGNGLTGIKLFVVSKGKQRFLEAHRLKQWWSDELELQMALNN